MLKYWKTNTQAHLSTQRKFLSAKNKKASELVCVVIRSSLQLLEFRSYLSHTRSLKKIVSRNSRSCGLTSLKHIPKRTIWVSTITINARKKKSEKKIIATWINFSCTHFFSFFFLRFTITPFRHVRLQIQKSRLIFFIRFFRFIFTFPRK